MSSALFYSVLTGELLSIPNLRSLAPYLLKGPEHGFNVRFLFKPQH